MRDRHNLLKIVCSLSLLLGAGGGRAEVQMTVRPGFEGIYKDGAWLPVTVTLENDLQAVQGELVIEVHDSPQEDHFTRYACPVDLPGSARKSYTLYVPATPYQPELQVVLRPRRGKDLVRKAPVRPADRNDLLVLVVNPEQAGLDFLSGHKVAGLSAEPAPQSYYGGGGVAGPRGMYVPPPPMLAGGGGMGSGSSAPGQVRVVHAAARDLPDHWIGYDGIDALVLQDAPLRTLSLRQQQALRAWLQDGGTLVACGGVDPAMAHDEFLKPLLPVQVQGTTSLRTLRSLGRRYQEWISLEGECPALRAVVQRGDVLAQEGDVPLIVRDGVGQGQVVYLALAYNAPPLKRWSGAARMWGELLGFNRRVPPARWEPGRWLGVLGEAVSQPPSVRTPSFAVVGSFLGLYLILLVPLNYFVLRHFKRKEWAWVTTPLIVVLFSVGAYAIGYSVKGGRLLLHTFSYVTAQANTSTAPAVTAFGIFSPGKARYDVQIAHAAPDVQELTPQDNPYNPRRRRGRLEVVQGETTRLPSVNVDMWAMRFFGTHTRADLGGGLKADLVYDGQEIRGTVRNDTPYTFQPAVLSLGWHTQKAATFPPGADMDVYFSLASGKFITARTATPLYDALKFPQSTEDLNAEVVNKVLGNLLGQSSEPWMGGPGGPYPAEPSRLPAAFWGWTESPVAAVTLRDRQPHEHHRTLFRGAVPVQMRSGGWVVLPGMAQQMITEQGGAVNHRGAYLALGNGQYTVCLTLPPKVRGLPIKKAELHVRCAALGQDVTIWISHRKYGRWMVLARGVDGYLRLPLHPPEHYIGRENGLLKVMVQGKGPKEAQIYLVDVLVEGE